jgi:glycosyltransferase involved in cell wall biosynthesis
MVRCVIEELQKIDSENTYYLYSDRDFDLPWEGDRWRKRVSSPLPLLPGTLWLQTVGRRMILRDRLDVFWGTVDLLPLGLPSAIAKVLTIHDLTWPLYSNIADPFHRCMFWLFFERSVRQADRIIAVSQSTARDLQHILRVPESKIMVVYNGVGPAYKPHDPRAASELVASKYGASKNYLLMVGTIAPHKNLVTVIEAMKILHERGELSFQLLAVGAKSRKDAKLSKALESSGLTGEDIRFLGFVPEEDLPILYSGSCLFVFPSLYEGFGLPLVEAMACGVPVVASYTSSTPEVVGDAALLVPPTRPEAFAEAILRVRSDADLRKAMIEKGFSRAASFRWDKAACQLLECMRNVVTEKGFPR